MRIVFAGTPEAAVPSLQTLVDSGPARGHEIVGVITREDAPLGRKRVITPSPVAQFLEQRGLRIPVYKTNRLDDAAVEWVSGLEPDLGVIVAYGGLVREPLLSLPTHGWINLHFSALPKWRGAAPVQRALMAGERRLGVSVFRLVEALDAGALLQQESHTFERPVSATSALQQLATIGAGTLERAIRELEMDPGAGKPQSGEATYAPKLHREDGRLDLTRTAAEVLAHWAGVTDEPGAYVEFEGRALKLREVAPLHLADTGGAQQPSAADHTPGTVDLVDGKAVLRLSNGALELVTVQPAGKAPMDGSAWLRGRGGAAVLS